MEYLASCAQHNNLNSNRMFQPSCHNIVWNLEIQLNFVLELNDKNSIQFIIGNNNINTKI